MRKHLLKTCVFFLLTAVFTGCAVTSYIGYRIAPGFPKNHSRTMDLKGLHHPVQVLIDAYDVPHIRAKDVHDVVMAVGYLHGRDRFFEMDMLRRIAQGRISELLGEQALAGGTTVDFDLAMKGWDMEDLAKHDVDAMAPAARALLKAYVQGVNLALKAFKPLEYRMLRVRPKPWGMMDSLAVGRLTAWSITHNWSQEATRLILALYDGLDAARNIWPSEPLPNNVSLNLDSPSHALPPSVVPELLDMFPGHKKTAANNRRIALPFFSGASNAWAVGGGLTRSHSPIVASDPHLLHMVPSFMYQEHLAWGKNDVIGAAIPGIPFVVAGHNGFVAWGITSTVADIVDLCIEKTRKHNQVLATDGKWVPVQRKKVVIRIRKGKKEIEKVFYIRHTPNGPVFNDMYPGVLPPWAPMVTIRMDKRPIGDSLFALKKVAGARSVMDLHRDLRTMYAPVNTFVAGDKAGNIAIFVAGRVPIRRDFRGTFPVPGWLAKYKWAGDIPYDDMPYGLAKGKASFVNANNLTVDPRRSKFIVNVDSAPNYRFQRIIRLLDAKNRHTTKSIEAIQLDQYLGRAQLLTPIMLKDLSGIKTDPIGQKALKILANWDFVAGKDAIAPTVFFAIYRFTAMDALSAQLDPGAFHFVMTRRYTTNLLDLDMQSADNPLWDDPATPQHEQRRTTIRRAFGQAIAFLKKRLGRDPAKWQWGRLHYINIHHVFGVKRLLAGYFNMPHVQIGGGMDSVWKTHFDMANSKHPFEVTAGPVWRMVVDLADINNGHWILDTGESGWPGSPNYKDQSGLWVKGRYIPMLMDWDSIKKTVVCKWTLNPEKAVK